MTTSKMTLSNPLVPLACGLWLFVGCDHDDDELGFEEDLGGVVFRSSGSGDFRSGKGLNTGDMVMAIEKAQAWLVSLGLDPAAVENQDLYHTAQRMVIADACGTESSTTIDGISVGYLRLLEEPDEDFRKIFRGDDMEAAWDKYGAVCVNYSRVGSEATCDLPRCPP